MGIKYGRGRGGARISLSLGLYSQESTFPLVIISFPSPTLSFILDLKPSFTANPSHCSPSFLLLKCSPYGFAGLFTLTSEHIRFYFLLLHF